MNDIFGAKIVRKKKGFVAYDQYKPEQFRYFIRHADFNANVKATIEKEVYVNLHSTILTDKPIEWIEEDPKNNYIQINKDGSYSKERNLVIK